MKLRLSPGEWFKYNFSVTFQHHVVDRMEKLAVRLFAGYRPLYVPFTVRMLDVDPRPTSRSRVISIEEAPTQA
ncbi:MAG: hypothetical protein PHQ04_03920 [Opitutaceae bacterium]|nr:hypothetical protein [Opitutaceae bacterium]